MNDILLKSVEKKFADNEKIRGHLAHLDDKRIVFIGNREEDKGTYYVGFRNAEGDDTFLRLSPEAMAMLIQLYRKPRNGDDVFPICIKKAWQVTFKEKE
jgi:hypothetical protein